MKSLVAGLLMVGAASTINAQWKYDSSRDKMTSALVDEASLVSDHSLRLRFPYAGENWAQLSVRKNAAQPSEVLLLFEKGQIMCRTGDCSIRMRFDDGKPMTFSGTRPADDASNALFLNAPRRFIDAAQKAQKIIVEVNFYQSGTQVVEFSAPSPLAWRSR